MAEAMPGDSHLHHQAFWFIEDVVQRISTGLDNDVLASSLSQSWPETSLAYVSQQELQAFVEEHQLSNRFFDLLKTGLDVLRRFCLLGRPDQPLQLSTGSSMERDKVEDALRRALTVIKWQLLEQQFTTIILRYTRSSFTLEQEVRDGGGGSRSDFYFLDKLDEPTPKLLPSDLPVCRVLLQGSKGWSQESVYYYNTLLKVYWQQRKLAIDILDWLPETADSTTLRKGKRCQYWFREQMTSLLKSRTLRIEVPFASIADIALQVATVLEGAMKGRFHSLAFQLRNPPTLLCKRTHAMPGEDNALRPPRRDFTQGSAAGCSSMELVSVAGVFDCDKGSTRNVRVFSRLRQVLSGDASEAEVSDLSPTEKSAEETTQAAAALHLQERYGVVLASLYDCALQHLSKLSPSQIDLMLALQEEMPCCGGRKGMPELLSPGPCGLCQRHPNIKWYYNFCSEEVCEYSKEKRVGMWHCKQCATCHEEAEEHCVDCGGLQCTADNLHCKDCGTCYNCDQKEEDCDCVGPPSGRSESGEEWSSDSAVAEEGHRQGQRVRANEQEWEEDSEGDVDEAGKKVMYESEDQSSGPSEESVQEGDVMEVCDERVGQAGREERQEDGRSPEKEEGVEARKQTHPGGTAHQEVVGKAYGSRSRVLRKEQAMAGGGSRGVAVG